MTHIIWFWWNSIKYKSTAWALNYGGAAFILSSFLTLSHLLGSVILATIHLNIFQISTIYITMLCCSIPYHATTQTRPWQLLHLENIMEKFPKILNRKRKRICLRLILRLWTAFRHLVSGKVAATLPPRTLHFWPIVCCQNLMSQVLFQRCVLLQGTPMLCWLQSPHRWGSILGYRSWGLYTRKWNPSFISSFSVSWWLVISDYKFLYLITHILFKGEENI